MGIIVSRKAYNAPQINTVRVKFRSVLCQSSEKGAANNEGYYEEYLDW